MSRKDTIIIAVLLNAGVLAILFMLAVNEREDDREFLHPAPPVLSQSVQVEKKPLVFSQPVTEEFIDFSMDDAVASIDDAYIPLGQQLRETPVVTKPKPPMAQASKPALQSSDTYVEVSVKRGDSLDKLARSNGTTIEAIKGANQLKSDMLSIGQILRIPVGNKVVVQKAPPPKKIVAESNEGSLYTVKTGDSPWKIAKQNNMNVEDLLKLNNLDEEKARNLKVGDKIRVKSVTEHSTAK